MASQLEDIIELSHQARNSVNSGINY